MRFAVLAAILSIICSAGAWADDTSGLRKRAESGDAEAQFELAWHYANEARNARSERRALRDQKRAFDWYTKSAEQGFAKAQFNLSRMYFRGQGVAADKNLATEWLTKAAAQGLAEAQFAVGNSYFYGGILERDVERALDLFVSAANQNHVPAQKQLGVIYFEGAAVPQDLVYAHLWFSIASLNNDKASGGYLPTLESIMDASQIEEARNLASEWQSDQKAE